MKKKISSVVLSMVAVSMFALTACGEAKDTVSENEVSPVSTEEVKLYTEPEATPEVTEAPVMALISWSLPASPFTRFSFPFLPIN